MNAAAPFLLALLAAFAEDGQNAASTAPAASRTRVEAQAPGEAVGFGAPFELIVKRSWKRNDPEEAFADRALSPLVVSLRGVERREVDGEIVETRRYEARAFGRDEVVVPDLSLRIEVKSSLGADPGPVEEPPGALDAPWNWKKILIRTAAGAAALAAAIAAYVYIRKRMKSRPVAAKPGPPPIPPHERALARLDALRRRIPATPEELQAYYVEASSIVRGYLEERFGLRAPEMTTEEFLNSGSTERELEPRHRTLLSEFLNHCDLVKFGRGASTPADRDRLVVSAERLVQETRLRETAAAAAPSDSQVIRASAARDLRGGAAGQGAAP